MPAHASCAAAGVGRQRPGSVRQRRTRPARRGCSPRPVRRYAGSSLGRGPRRVARPVLVEVDRARGGGVCHRPLLLARVAGASQSTGQGPTRAWNARRRRPCAAAQKGGVSCSGWAVAAAEVVAVGVRGGGVVGGLVVRRRGVGGGRRGGVRGRGRGAGAAGGVAPGRPARRAGSRRWCRRARSPRWCRCGSSRRGGAGAGPAGSTTAVGPAGQGTSWSRSQAAAAIRQPMPRQVPSRVTTWSTMSWGGA